MPTEEELLRKAQERIRATIAAAKAEAERIRRERAEAAKSKREGR